MQATSSTREIKKAAWNGIDREFTKIVEGLKTGDEEPFVKFLEYCAGKTSRWSLVNIAKLYAEGIQNPVTDSQLPRLQHRLKPGVQKTWIFMPVMIDESGEVVKSAPVPPIAAKPVREQADRVEALSPATADVVQWLNANSSTKPVLWEAFTAAVPPAGVPAPDSDAYVAWWTERQESFSGWVAERYGQEIQAWAMTRPQEATQEAEQPQQAKLRRAYAMSRVIVDLHRMTTGPEVPQPKVNPTRVFHLLSRYAKEEGVKVVDFDAGEGTANEIAIDNSQPDNVKAIALAAGLIGRAFDLRNGEDDSEARQVQVEAATFVVARTLGVQARFSVVEPTAWGEDIKAFSENMRSVATISQTIVRGVIQTMNVVQAERQAELQRQIQDESAAKAQAAEEAREDIALAESVTEETSELTGMSAA